MHSTLLYILLVYLKNACTLFHFKLERIVVVDGAFIKRLNGMARLTLWIHLGFKMFSVSHEASTRTIAHLDISISIILI